MTRLTSLPERALELASTVGDNLRHAMPAVGERAGRLLETGVALGALKTGARAAGGFVRRHPLLVATAVAGAGLLWYAAQRKARQARNGENRDEAEGAIEGHARRIEARRSTTARPRRPARSRHDQAAQPD